ncbi:DUF4123 domain-containing protein [Neisseriaceae bacterium ESL0693]|nr:DUF4123 domain-containing protein [Neisseriaceae bacterium ESL0693]
MVQMIEKPIKNSKELVQNMLKATESLGHEQLFLLIDLCDIQQPLLATIASWQPKQSYWLLFEQTPEASISEHGPLLLSLDIHNLSHIELLQKISQHCYNDNRLIGFNSTFPASTLVSHLRAAMQLSWHDDTGEKKGLLRYYVPDLFEAVNNIFTPFQYNWFHQYTLQWFFMPDDGQWQIMPVVPAKQTQLSVSGLVFTDTQYHLLLLWSDAFRFYRKYKDILQSKYHDSQRVLLLKLYEIACRADKAGIYSQDKLEQYYFNELGISHEAAAS